MSALGAYPHLILSSTGEETDFVDAALAGHKLARRVSLRVPLLAAAATLAQSDMIAIPVRRHRPDICQFDASGSTDIAV